MATDIAQIVENIGTFHDFTDKRVIVVGAGGGRLIDYVRSARRVIAVDHDEETISSLTDAVRERGLDDKFTIVHSDFLSLRCDADVVVFEFSLHEMTSPDRAVAYARHIAAEVVVVDHVPESRWSWFAAEEEAVARCWTAVCAFPLAKQRDIVASQHFRDFEELETRFVRQGPQSHARIEALRHQAPILIPMPYRLVLLEDKPTQTKRD